MVAIDSDAVTGARRTRDRMAFAAHLAELRRRVLVAAAALVLGMTASFFLTDLVIQVLTEPIRIVATERGDGSALLNFETVTSAFDLRLRIAFSVGILVSAPIWLWQLWGFIVPGLTRRELWYTVAFMSAAVPLFFAGCAAGLWMMPHIVEMMATFVPEQGAMFYTASFYYDFVFKLLLTVGTSFVLPVFLVALNLAGVVSGRTIVKQWRAAIVVAAVFAALATPAADVMSMLLLTGVLVGLFLAAAGLSLLLDHRRAKRLGGEAARR